VKRHGANLIYCHEIGSWYFWDGKHWVRDTVGKALKLAKETIRDLIIRVKSDPQAENSEKRLKFLVRAETSAKFESILKLAKPDLAINTQLFDNDLCLLNVQNGTIDLRTGELLEHNKENYQTKIAGTHYDPQAKCDLFESFLNTIFNGDSKLIAFLKRVLGYSLTGLNSEQCWFLLYGTGANGKSTLVNIIRYIMGDYSSYTPADTFQLSFGDRIRNDLARLRGSRFISASEPDKTKKLDTELLKSFTGGESVTSRYLHKEFFEYNPTGKLFISANHYPSVNANDHGFWRRVKMIPFNVTIPLEDRKKDFELKFRTESAGILRWMVEGCVERFKTGLELPESVIEATSGYKDDMDVLSDFLAAPCVEIDSEKNVKKIDLFSYYSNWLNDKGIRHLGLEEFNRAMTAKGFQTKQLGEKRNRCWLGIGLKPQD
jgi:putative DNA primase/helicase